MSEDLAQGYLSLNHGIVARAPSYPVVSAHILQWPRFALSWHDLLDWKIKGTP